ncbi:MAG: septum formation protein Maf [Candidatus Omnitrophica bacterium]|nr:septum formation protein Maf [Candidatus Omnitrophota bacterium]
MRKIILASASKARRRLLEQIGLKFKVATSRIKEDRRLRGACSDLVVSNALKKARDVARRQACGIVIAADTVVLVGKKIIGKPESIKDAFRTLKLLSKSPQWVYSGIAVIDIDRGKAYTEHEKTKIWMYPLTDAEIRRYFRKVSPLDKAGSFDIQGMGGIFIDRIEGCFYNVVGLPLAKLARMLKKAGVDIF